MNALLDEAMEKDIIWNQRAKAYFAQKFKKSVKEQIKNATNVVKGATNVAKEAVKAAPKTVELIKNGTSAVTKAVKS